MDAINLSAQQIKAINSVEAWLKSGTASKQVFRLFGHAGTGKTTIARSIADRVGGKVLFAAFTGKAALRLMQVGCTNSSTIHGLIYHFVGRHNSPTGFEVDPNSEASRADLIIIDECSMIGTALARDLLSFGRPALAIGDPGQLPPIGEADGFFTAEKPDVKLTTIHRQAEQDPILHLATLARQGKSLPAGDLGSCRVLGKADSFHRYELEFDQILTHSNLMRRYVNMRRRNADERKTVFPEPGERLICLRNNSGTGVFNGEQFLVHEVKNLDQEGKRIDIMVQSLNVPERPKLTVSIASECFTNPSEVKHSKRTGVHWFDYAYGITVHKAQGSEWDRVLIITEPGIKADDRRRWLYTAITRARKSVMIGKSQAYMYA